MKQDLTLKVRCWKCKETFHLVVGPADRDEKSGLVLMLVPCPYCQASCQLTLREDQCFTTVIHKGASDPAQAPQTWAQLSKLERSRTVFDTTEPKAAAPKPPPGPSNPARP